MIDIAEFLTARLDEDAAMAHEAAAFYDDADENGVSWSGHEGENQNGFMNFWLVPHLGVIYDPASGRHIVRHNPARVLADVAAKRRILAEHSQIQIEHSQILTWHDPSVFRCRTCDPGCQCYPGGDGFGICDTLRFMAAPYADHPDYDESWRP